MQQQKLTPHESIDLHEILTFKNNCLTKSATMSALVSDGELKSILQKDVTTSEQHIREISCAMQQSIALNK